MAAPKKLVLKRRNSLKTLKFVLSLVDKHGLNVLEFNGIRVEKARHAAPAPAARSAEPAKKNADPELPRVPGMPVTIEQLDAQIKHELGIVPGGAF